jgi:hypothetical protein
MHQHGERGRLVRHAVERDAPGPRSRARRPGPHAEIQYEVRRPRVHCQIAQGRQKWQSPCRRRNP